MKYITTLLVLLVVFVSGCTDSPEDYNKDFERTDIDLKIVLFDNKRDLNKHLQKYGDKKFSNYTVKGYSEWSSTKPTCTLYLVKSEILVDDDNVTTWGHELKHCVHGSFHK